MNIPDVDLLLIKKITEEQGAEGLKNICSLNKYYKELCKINKGSINIYLLIYINKLENILQELYIEFEDLENERENIEYKLNETNDTYYEDELIQINNDIEDFSIKMNNIKTELNRNKRVYESRI